MDGSFLLRAALDHGTSDAALRLLIGIHAEVAEKIAKKPERTEAYVPIEKVERLTGLDRRTVYAVANEVTERLGGLALTSQGKTFVLAEGEDFGVSASWTTALVISPTANLDPGLDIRLNDNQWMPGNDCWSRQHRAWRLYLCLIATHGRVRLDHVSTKEIVRIIGGAPQHARRVFRALQAAVHSEGQTGVDLTVEIAEIWHSDYDRAMSFIDPRAQVKDRDKWLNTSKAARGDVMPEVEETVTAPTPVDTRTREEIEHDDAESRDRINALRRRVQGDPLPGFERTLRNVEEDLALERGVERWTGDRGRAEIERLTSTRDGLLSQIEALMTA